MNKGKVENPVLKYQSQRLGFDMFCEQRGWTFHGFMHNKKNSKQYHGSCFNQQGEFLHFLISENGKYYQLLGNGKYREYDYVLKGGKSDGQTKEKA